MYARAPSNRQTSFASKLSAAQAAQAAWAAGRSQQANDVHDSLRALDGNSAAQAAVQRLDAKATHATQQVEPLQKEIEDLREQNAELRKENCMLRKGAGRHERDQDEELVLQLLGRNEELQAQIAELRVQRGFETMAPSADACKLQLELEQVSEERVALNRLYDARLAELREANQQLEEARADNARLHGFLQHAELYLNQLRESLAANQIAVPDAPPLEALEPSASEEASGQSEGRYARFKTGVQWLSGLACQGAVAATNAAVQHIAGARDTSDGKVKPNYVHLEDSQVWVATASDADREAVKSLGSSASSSPRTLYEDASQAMIDMDRLNLGGSGDDNVVTVDAPPSPAPAPACGKSGKGKGGKGGDPACYEEFKKKRENAAKATKHGRGAVRTSSEGKETKRQQLARQAKELSFEDEMKAKLATVHARGERQAPVLPGSRAAAADENDVTRQIRAKFAGRHSDEEDDDDDTVEWLRSELLDWTRQNLIANDDWTDAFTLINQGVMKGKSADSIVALVSGDDILAVGCLHMSGNRESFVKTAKGETEYVKDPETGEPYKVKSNKDIYMYRPH